MSIARGYDPRDFTLVAFGGAGPLHACAAADRLDIPRVLVPPAPGVLCALGLLLADVAVEYSRSVMRRADEDAIAALKDIRRELLDLARAELEREGIRDDEMRFIISLDMRYEGQAYELNIPFGDAAAQAFHAEHERSYGHAMRWRNVEIINIRAQGLGSVDKPGLDAVAVEPHAAESFGEKLSPIDGAIKMYERDELKAGAMFEGEALVFQMDSTTYVPSGWRGQVDGYMNLLLERV